jgi:phosphatidylglycerol:prolipoprotein diacylglycerol transferase
MSVGGVAARFAPALLEIPYPHLDPVALDLPGPLDLRWYGLGYMLGFGVGYLILRALQRRGFLRLKPTAVSDLIFALVLGVILGGRLGYILFYDLPAARAHPLSVLRIWEGGLSFHGGLIGVAVAGVWFARNHQAAWRNLGDAIALSAGSGIFAVRVANFINGELYGRVASPSVPWAMRFPTDPKAQALLHAERVHGMRARELLIDRAYASGEWARLERFVPLRHPSQLYEALGEGVLCSLLVWAALRWNQRRGVVWGDGAYLGLFLTGYGCVRTVLEQFRQPDAQFASPGNPLGTVLGPLSMGQVLSLATLAAGLALLVAGIRAARPAGELPSPAEPAPESAA